MNLSLITACVCLDGICSRDRLSLIQQSAKKLVVLGEYFSNIAKKTAGGVNYDMVL